MVENAESKSSFKLPIFQILNLFVCFAGMMRFIFTSLLMFFVFFGKAQNYVDLAKFTHSNVPNTSLDVAGSEDLETSIMQSKILTSLPIKLSDSLAFLMGVDYENHSIQLKRLWGTSNMNIATLKLGFNVKHNTKLSATYLALPKLAGDYGDFSNSFQIGAIALFKYQMTSQTKLVFGNYINKELFGILNVPIIGLYHKSKSGKFESDIKFPIVGFGDYNLNKNFRVGADFLMIVRSFDLTKGPQEVFYSHMASNEFGVYVQFDLLKESLIIQAKAVYAGMDYGTYLDGDTTPLGMWGWYPDDERTRFNGNVNGALGFKVTATYRFQLGE